MEANQISCSKCGGTSFTKDGETAKCNYCGADYDIAQFRALSPEAEQRMLQIASDNLARLRELAEMKEARILQNIKDEVTPKRKVENADFLTDLNCSEEKRKQIEEEEKRRLIQEQEFRQEQINRIKRAADKRKREKEIQAAHEKQQKEAQIIPEEQQKEAQIAYEKRGKNKQIGCCFLSLIAFTVFIIVLAPKLSDLALTAFIILAVLFLLILPLIHSNR